MFSSEKTGRESTAETIKTTEASLTQLRYVTELNSGFRKIRNIAAVIRTSVIRYRTKYHGDRFRIFLLRYHTK